MFLKSIYLKNFRSYKEAEVNFSPKINAIFGENAQGKTNLLEAISLISTGRSFRTQHLNDLILDKEPFFYLGAEVVKEGVSHSIKLSFDGQKKKLQIDSNTYGSFHPLIGFLPLILSAPIDEELISGSPQIRRRFLNLHLAQSDPLYVHHLTRYWRAMKERNCLLRSKKGDEIECYEVEMATSAAYIFEKRTALIEELKGPLARISETLSLGKESHEIKFHPTYPRDSEKYLAQMNKNRGKEKEIGSTLTGPHRDELSFWILGKTSRIFASEGQKKTTASALRLAEWERLFSKVEGKPLFAIDDLGLPLDPVRLKLFSESLLKLGQVFITTPSPSELYADHFIEIANGTATIDGSKSVCTK